MEEASQLTLKASARIVGSDENPISTETLRRCALRLDIAERDAQGRILLPRWAVEQFRRNFQAVGYLAPRGARCLRQPQESA